ncbi:MAG: mechanosensitive ion channel, partial [Magnetococcales bacterium]|nr:mechanosensitive ion channel [Magnetococcales bacterium]
MDSLTLISLMLGGFLTIFVLATLLTLPFRSSRPAPTEGAEGSRKPGSGLSESWLAIIMEHVSRPLVVLFLTLMLAKLFDSHPEWLGETRMDPRYLKAWYLFWLIVLFFNINEAMGRLFYHVRKQQFPVPSLLLYLLRLLLIGASAFAIFHFVLDFDTSHLFTSTAVVAAVVGLALREVLGNLLAGLSMNLVGTVEPSQWIAIGEKEGEIIHRNWRETRLRSTGGHIYIVPNSILANSVLNNMTWNSPLRRHQFTFTLSFGSTPDAVKSVLMEAMLSVPEVDRSKKPDAHVHEFRDYGVVYQVRFWSRTFFDRTKLEGMVRERVWYALRRHGLTIPFPDGGSVYSVAPTLIPPEDKQPAENARLLLQCGFFQKLLADRLNLNALDQEKITTFAHSLRHKIYGPYEVIFQQGETGESCFIVARGILTGITRYEGLSTTQEFRVECGELVGEMALLTDLPRTATIRADQEEVEVLEL